MKKKILVVDTSVMVKWINRQDEEDVEKADQIRHDAHLGKVVLIAPELAKYEIGNALLYKDVTLPISKLSLVTIYSLPIDFQPLNQNEAIKILEIAAENKITYYDASFIQLAKEKNATLITANPKHQRQFAGVKVIDLKNYH